MILESFRIAIGAIWVNKMRSLLTTLGIVIGVSATVAVVSLVQGFFAVIERQFEGLGTNAMHISPNRPAGTDGQKLGRIVLDWNDGQALKDSIETIDEIVPEFFESAIAKHGEEQARTFLVGTTARYQDVRGFYVGKGRFFSQVDDRSRSRVCAIGSKLVETLKIEGEPVGQTITLQNEEFRIVGVMEKQGELLGESFDDFVLIPYSTAATIYGTESTEQIGLTLTTTSPESVEQTRDRITDLLRRRHGLTSDQPDDFEITSQEQLMGVLGKIIGGFTAVLGGIVSISLVVGGIGIMNIMLVSVTERMREIGLRKAIGAPKNLILLQFLIESVTISLVGGVIGIVLGVVFGYGLAAVIPDWPGAFIPLWALALSFGFASLIGAIFGIYPAYRAAQLDPIESLRYE